MNSLVIVAAAVLIGTGTGTGTGALAGHVGISRVKAAADVATTMNALEAAVTGAGAIVFARVDHAAGAEVAGMELVPSQADLRKPAAGHVCNAG